MISLGNIQLGQGAGGDIIVPPENYQNVPTFSALPSVGDSSYIYRVASWDGTQVDASKYSEYVWTGSAYQLLRVSSAIEDVFDISLYHATGGVLAKYADLAAALGASGANVPDGVRSGGMQIKFVQSSDNNYVQFRYMLKYENTTAGNSAFVNPENWQGVVNYVSQNNKNLVTSEGVAEVMPKIVSKTDLIYTDLNSGAILSNGGVDTNSWNGYVYTNPINIKAGDTIIIKDGNTPSYVGRGAAAISKVITAGESYQQLVAGVQSAIYSYTAEEDMNVALCYNSSNNCYYTIEKLDKVVGLAGYIYNMIITESFLLISATYQNNVISSAVVKWSDDTDGSISITRDYNGFVTQLDAVYGSDTYRITVSRTNGNVTSTNIIKL